MKNLAECINELNKYKDHPDVTSIVLQLRRIDPNVGFTNRNQLKYIRNDLLKMCVRETDPSSTSDETLDNDEALASAAEDTLLALIPLDPVHKDTSPDRYSWWHKNDIDTYKAVQKKDQDLNRAVKLYDQEVKAGKRDPKNYWEHPGWQAERDQETEDYYEDEARSYLRDFRW